MKLNHQQLDALQEEAVYIIREVAATAEHPALLFSGGKDSVVVLALAAKAFRLPGRRLKLPFALVHIDTGHNYPEVIAFRDETVNRYGAKLVVGHVEDSIARGTVVLKHAGESRNAHQAVTLLETIEAHGFDALLGGARRDEEKARAKERIFSFRDEFIDSTPWAWGIAICGVALTNFAVVGVYSRTIGRENPYTISLNSAVLLGVVVRILGPIPKMLIWVGNVIAPGPGFRDGPYSTEMELRELVDIAQEKGVVERDERRMIQNVFDLGDSIAREVMVPRPEMLWIESGKSAGKATSLCVRSGHSRIPVIGETVDDILGVVYLKDLVRKTYYHTDGGASVSVDQVMRAATFVPESKNLNDLLHEMQADRFHIAMVVDEFGGIAGLFFRFHRRLSR